MCPNILIQYALSFLYTLTLLNLIFLGIKQDKGIHWVCKSLLLKICGKYSKMNIDSELWEKMKRKELKESDKETA